LAPVIEWRARQIDDPIERLGYLRRSVKLRPVSPHRNLRRICMLLGALVITGLVSTRYFPVATADGQLPPVPVAAIHSSRAAEAAVPKVWLVEQNKDYDVYSNGLRIENRFRTTGDPRSSGRLDRRKPEQGLKISTAEPVGIVYHTTESELAPFESDQNKTLKRLGTSLLEFVRNKRAYNFVIDRFGRVFRVVDESTTAYHAGSSAWADSDWIYLNVNASFVGISFEAQSVTGNEKFSVTPAQIYSGRILTQWLRSRYQIAAANCVTHAQVSVNPENMRIGYHTDWAGNFPFEEMGLSDNYALPLPSLYAFGFSYDPVFVMSTGARLWKGVVQAEQELRQASAAAKLAVPEYRKTLQQRYRKNLAALKARSAIEEKSSE
jgi:hypothetical protein